MTNDTDKPVILLAFANEPPGARGHLRNLGEYLKGGDRR